MKKLLFIFIILLSTSCMSQRNVPKYVPTEEEELMIDESKTLKSLALDVALSWTVVIGFMIWFGSVKNN